ncbi:MAG: hypothetical protein QXW41_08525 [Fervidicoccaceae archaeon]
MGDIKGFNHKELFRRSRILKWLTYIAGYITPFQMRSLLMEAAAAAAKHTDEPNVYRVLWSIGFIPTLEDIRRIKINIYRKSEIEALREVGFFTDGYVDIDDMDITIPRIYYIYARGKPEENVLSDSSVNIDSYKAPNWILFIPPNYERLYIYRSIIISGVLVPRKAYPGFSSRPRELIIDDLSRLFISEDEIVKKYGGDYKKLFDEIPEPVGVPIKDGRIADIRSVGAKILRLALAAVAKGSKELTTESTNLAVELALILNETPNWYISDMRFVIHNEQNPEVKKKLLRTYAYSAMRYYTYAGVAPRDESLFYTGKVLEWERNPELYKHVCQSHTHTILLENTVLQGSDVFSGKGVAMSLARPYADIMWRAITDEELAEFTWLDHILFDERDLKRWAYSDEYVKTVLPFTVDRIRALMLSKEGADLLKIFNFFSVFVYDIAYGYLRIYKLDSHVSEELWNKYSIYAFQRRYWRYLSMKHMTFSEYHFYRDVDADVSIFRGIDEDWRKKSTFLRTPDAQFFRDYAKHVEKIYLEVAGDCNIHDTSSVFDRLPKGSPLPTMLIECGAYSTHCMSDQRFEGAFSSDPSTLVMPVEESAVGGILESWSIGLYNDGGLLYTSAGKKTSITIYIEFPTLIVRREIGEHEINPDKKPVRRRFKSAYLNIYEFDVDIPYARIHTYPPPRHAAGVFTEDMDPYPAQALSPGFNEVKIYSEHLYGLRPVYSIVHSLRTGLLDPVSAADLFHAVGIVAVATKPECMEALLSGRASREILKICCERCYQPGKEFVPHGARPMFVIGWGVDLINRQASKPPFTVDDYIALYARIAAAASKHLEEITWRSASIALSRSRKDRNSFASPAGASLFTRHLMDVVLSAYMLTRWGPSCSAKPGDRVVAVNEENLLRIIRSLPRNTPLGMLPWEVKRGPMAADVITIEEIEKISGERIWPIVRPGGYFLPRAEVMSGLAPRPLYKGLAIVTTLGEDHEVSRFILRSIAERIEILGKRMEAAIREAASPSDASIAEELKRLPPSKLGSPIPSKEDLGRARVAASKRYRVMADEYRRAIQTIGRALRWFRVAEDLQRRAEEIVGDLG